MAQYANFKTLTLGVILTLTTFCVAVHCKAMAKADKSTETDPLQATASQPKEIHYNPAAQGQQQQIQYQPLFQRATQQYTHSSQQQATSHPEAGYFVVKQPEQILLSADRAEHQHDGNCNQKHEYVSLSNLMSGENAPISQAQETTKNRDYPGEILYVDQNGNTAQVNNARELIVEPQLQQQQPSDLGSVSQMISQSSGMPATILTEIPVRDLPEHVLNKLKKDYGVKVVATREHPGANLVINCDDQSNYETSICISQRQPAHNLREDTNPTPYNPGYEGQNGGPAPVGQHAPLIEDSGERPNIPERVEDAHFDSHPENAPLEGEQEREYNVEQPNYNNEESYGSRNSAIADQEHQQEQSNVNENVHTQEEPRSQGEGA